MFGGGWEEWLGEMIWKLCWLLRWILPQYYANWTQGIFSHIFKLLDYDENKIMTELGCDKVSSLKIFMDIRKCGILL